MKDHRFPQIRSFAVIAITVLSVELVSARPMPIKFPKEPPPFYFSPSGPAIFVDGANRKQTVDGFGGSLTLVQDDGVYYRHDSTQPRTTSATTAQIAGITGLLYSELGITRTRFVQSGMEPQNDNGDPFLLDPSRFNWKLTDAAAPYYMLAHTAGLRTWWTSFETLDAGDAWKRLPGSPCTLDPAKLEEHVESVFAVIQRLHQQGAAPRYTAINNEPDLCGSERKVDPAGTVLMVRSLGRRLANAGIFTGIVVSDAWIPERGVEYMRAVLQDAEARQYVAALAYHSYDGMNNVDYLLAANSVSGSGNFEQARYDIHQLALTYRVPVWMSEVCYCTASGRDEFELILARMAHVDSELNFGVSAFDAMNLFFIQRSGIPDQLVHIWFNTDGTLQRYEIAPYGRVLSHYSKYVPAGSVRLATGTNTEYLQTTAFERPDGGLSVVVINAGVDAVDIQITLSGLTRTPAAVKAVRSRTGALMERLSDQSIGTNGFRATLPPRSITTYYSE